MNFKTTIHGITCYCNILDFQPGDNGVYHLSPEHSVKYEPAEFNFELVSFTGARLEELEQSLTDQDIEDLLTEYNYQLIELML